MLFDNRRDDEPIQPTHCTCVLFIRALTVNRALRDLLGLPNVVTPTERFVCDQRCGNFPFGQDELNRLLGVVPAKDDFRPK